MIDFSVIEGPSPFKGLGPLIWVYSLLDMEDQMKENNEVQPVIGEKTITWAGILAVAFLMLLVLGVLIYNFVVPVP